jgi:hypothetical protein
LSKQAFKILIATPLTIAVGAFKVSLIAQILGNLLVFRELFSVDQGHCYGTAQAVLK